MPLTIGLAVLLAIMETVYVMTGRTVWRQMTKFWGVLFGINFALGVSTGIVMEFQFGMNWSYYSHYVGDVFGAPLAIEGLMAFFLEATFVGMFFFGWERMSKVAHCVVTWLVALGTNFSALWILIANGWMQNPVGARLNPRRCAWRWTASTTWCSTRWRRPSSCTPYRPATRSRHSSCWACRPGTCAGAGTWSLARRSMTVAASFGLAASLSVVVLGDESGYATSEHQKMKLAAVEAMWDTEPAPASFTAIGWPDQEARKTHYAVHIPG